MQRAWLSLVVGLVAGGCEVSQEQARRDFCTAACECVTSGLPIVVERCVEEDCLPNVPAVSDACLECVYTHSQSCSELDEQCDAPCSSSLPLLGGM